jgi:peroxiredoxin
MTESDNAPSDGPPATRSGRGAARCFLVVAPVGVLLAGSIWLAGPTIRLQTQAFGPSANGSGANQESPVERGRLVYQSRCARRHGPDGHGDGPDAAALRQPLRDLASATWRSAAVRDDVRRIVVDGVRHEGMYGVAGALSATDQEAVVDRVLGFELATLLQLAALTPGTGQSAPPIAYRDLTGSIGSLEQLKGNVVLVVFWNTQCERCLKDLPAVQRLSDRYQGKRLVVLPVCLDEPDPKKAAEVAATRSVRVPVCSSVNPAIRLDYCISYTPQVALIDQEGRWSARSFGISHWESKTAREFLCKCLGVHFALEPEGSTGE